MFKLQIILIAVAEHKQQSLVHSKKILADLIDTTAKSQKNRYHSLKHSLTHLQKVEKLILVPEHIFITL